MATLKSLAGSLGAQINPSTSDCCLIELDSDGSPVGSNLAFQYYPESISDTKAVNYQQKEIFGGSLPLYQWTNGGERSVSFTAVFTCDVDLLANSATPGTLNQTLLARLKAAGEDRRNIDIRSAILWLRQYMIPTYSTQGSADSTQPLTIAPATLLLSMPGTGIGMYGGDAGGGSSTLHSMYCYMTQCDVSIDALFPSGLPRIVTVQLAFAQTGQIAGAVTFPSRTQRYDALRAGGLFADFAGYNQIAKGKS